MGVGLLLVVLEALLVLSTDRRPPTVTSIASWSTACPSSLTVWEKVMKLRKRFLSFFLSTNKNQPIWFFRGETKGTLSKDFFCWGCESLFGTWLVMKMYKGFQWFLSHAGFYCPWCCLGGTLGRPIKVCFCCSREISLPHLKTNSNVWRIWKFYVGWVKIFYNSHWHM